VVGSSVEACPAGVGTVDGRGTCDIEVVGFLGFERLVDVVTSACDGGVAGGAMSVSQERSRW